MNHELDLTEAALPYEVRHSVWDPKPVEEQLEEQGLYEPDAVYLFPVPDNEEERHLEQVEELVGDIETPDTVYFNSGTEEYFSEVLEEMDNAEHVPINYPEQGSRKADFQALNEYFDSDQTFLGIAQDYSVPRNHREAARHVDGWNGPENGFAFEVEDEVDSGSSAPLYLIDRLNTRSWGRETPDFMDRVDLKDGDHFVVGTTYSDDFSDYSPKFGVGKQSELVRSAVPQKLKDFLKDTPAVDDSEI
jgi:hypothetical protein